MGTMCEDKKILWFLLRSLQSSRGQMTAHELVREQGNPETFVLKNPARPSEEAGVRAGGSVCVTLAKFLHIPEPLFLRWSYENNLFLLHRGKRGR